MTSQEAVVKSAPGEGRVGEILLELLNGFRS